MMATTMSPPAVAPKQASGDVRFVAVRAHLLPGEVVSARQAEVVRKQVIAGLIAVVVLLAGWYGYSRWQTHSANSDLSAAQSQGVALQNQQNQFSPLVQAQAQITTMKGQLQTLMADDLQWKTLLTTLQAKAPHGVTIASVSGTVNAQSATGAATTGSAVLNTAGVPAIGQLTLSGAAPDKRTVAAFADSLTTVTGLSAPFISSVDGNEAGVSFTISAIITSHALGGRYSTPTTSSTGGN